MNFNKDLKWKNGDQGEEDAAAFGVRILLQKDAILL